MKEENYPKKKSTGDIVHSLAKGGIGMIPIAGVPASELLNLIVTPSLEKRRTQWFEDIGTRLKILEENNKISLEELSKNEEFIDITLQATQVALRTSQKEKKEALKNVIINSAKPNSLDFTIKQMFINCIDSFTDLHLKILDIFSDTRKWPQSNDNSSWSHFLEDVFPDLSKNNEIFLKIWNDLYSHGLVKTNLENLPKEFNRPRINISFGWLIGQNISKLGEIFIEFIREEK